METVTEMSIKLKSNYRKDKELRIFQLDNKQEIYEEIELNGIQISEILHEYAVYIFFKGKDTAWIWIGNKASNRMRYMAANKADQAKSIVGSVCILRTIDQGLESNHFKDVIKYDIKKIPIPEPEPTLKESIKENKELKKDNLTLEQKLEKYESLFTELSKIKDKDKKTSESLKNFLESLKQ